MRKNDRLDGNVPNGMEKERALLRCHTHSSHMITTTKKKAAFAAVSSEK
jgi:hypothetical protein